MPRYLTNAKLCGARSKQNDHAPCKQPAIKNKNRCRLHGGLSTGPKTHEGKVHSAQANLKHGMHTKEAIAERLYYREMLSWKDDTVIF